MKIYVKILKLVNCELEQEVAVQQWDCQWSAKPMCVSTMCECFVLVDWDI